MKARNLTALLLVALAFLSVPAIAAPTPTPKGAEIRVSTDARVSHRNPSVSAFRDGGFVVAWTANGGVRARFLDSRGRPTSGEIPLKMGGLVGTLDQVVADRDGSFLVVMTSERPVESVYVRRFNRNGTPKGKLFRPHLPSHLARSGGVAAIAPDGRFAVAWRALVSWSGEGSDYTNAVVRIFSARGTPLTPEITLREGDPGTFAGDNWTDALPSSLAIAPDGTLSALIQDNGAVDLGDHLARLNLNGEPSPQVQHIAGCGFPYDTTGSLAMGADGSVVAAWSCYDAVALRLSPSGAPRGAPFLISQEFSDYQLDPSVALQAGGSFVIVWTDQAEWDGDGKGIFGRAFAPNGTPRTGDFLVNVTTAGDQHEPAIAAPRRGNVLVVWSQTIDGQSGIFARVLAATP